MALLFSATATDRVDLAADGARDITRGALLAWAYLTSTNLGRIAVLVDPVNLRNVQDFGIITAGANLAMLHDFVTTDLNATAAFANFSAYGLNKWLRLACVWDHGAGATAQKLYVGDESTGLAEPSSYSTQQDGAGGWQARDASSFWKLGNRRQNDANLKGRLSDVLLVDRTGGSNPTAAEMDAWFTAPGRFAGAAWGMELGVGGTGLVVKNLYGTSPYTGTVTGATVDAHRAAKPYLRRRVVHVGPGLAPPRAPSVATRSGPLQLATSSQLLAGVRADATATALVGSLSLGGTITLVGTLANATAAGVVGALDVSGGVSLTGSRANATASGLAGAIDVSGGVSLVGTRANATAAALAGSLPASGLTLTGTLAAAGAVALAGSLSVNGTVTLAGQRASAAAAARTGTILFAVVLPTSVRLTVRAGPRYRFTALEP